MAISNHVMEKVMEKRYISREEMKEVMGDAVASYLFAVNVLNERFEQGEEAIAKDAFFSYLYAVLILRDRFELGEPAINKSSLYKFKYEKNVLKEGLTEDMLTRKLTKWTDDSDINYDEEYA